MRVAAYQAPLLPAGSMRALDLIRAQVRVCESAGIEILCCPEAVLGGLADDAPDPRAIAIRDDEELDRMLAPLASDRVAVIVGLTEIDAHARLFNTAAIFHGGRVLGRYRKRHPAINRSIYSPGDAEPVFTVGALTFGVIICNDSNDDRLVARMVSQGAAALFVPTNNGLPPAKGGPGLVAACRAVDRRHALAHGIDVVRADVAGAAAGRLCHGATAIVNRAGDVVAAAPALSPGLVTAEIGDGAAT